jgi:hypothetical protein
VGKSAFAEDGRLLGCRALMLDAARTSDTSVNLYLSVHRYNPEDGHICTHRRENLKSYLAVVNVRYFS